MKTHFIKISIVLFTMFVYSCAGIQTKEGVMPYKEALEKWSRQAKIYSSAASEVTIIDATYKSDEFRESFVAEYSRLYGLENVDGAKRVVYSEIVANKEQEAQHMEFFISLYTPDTSWNDLHKKDSIWSLYIETEGGDKVEPLSIERVSRADVRTEKFYPYMGPWSKAYVVKFSKVDAQGSSFKLLAYSVKGKASMEWKLQENNQE